jgi:hypothetical protein
MKKLFFIAMMTIAGFGTAQAQQTSGFKLGGNIGANFAAVTDNSGQNSTDAITSFNIAATGEYYFSDRWGLKAKLILDNKGWGNGFISDGSGNVTITDFSLTYLTLPVMANWHFGSTRKWYLNFGLYAGFLLNGEADANGMDISEAIQSVDVGLALGIGYKFPIAENTFMFIEYDGQGGFLDVFEDNLGDAVRNSRSSFNLGILFPLN